MVLDLKITHMLASIEKQKGTRRTDVFRASIHVVFEFWNSDMCMKMKKKCTNTDPFILISLTGWVGWCFYLCMISLINTCNPAVIAFDRGMASEYGTGVTCYSAR